MFVTFTNIVSFGVFKLRGVRERPAECVGLSFLDSPSGKRASCRQVVTLRVLRKSPPVQTRHGGKRWSLI